MQYLIIIAVTAAALFWAIRLYNLLVRDSNRVDAGWSDIDVQLKRRHNVISKLVEVVKQYAAYERATLTAITELRRQSEAATTVTDRGTLETQLGASLRQLVAVAESYPELNASASFLDLQQQISRIEDDIQHARRYYNGTVRNLNTRVDSFPDLLLARLFNYRYREYFEYDPP